MIRLARILYPTDFSDLSLVALKYAISFSEQYDAKLYCLHVVDEAYQYWLSMGPEGVPMGPDMNQMLHAAQEQMSQFVDEHLKNQPNLITKVISGKPFVEIVRYAREHEIDIIVMATHGRSGFKYALMGSVAERVVRRAPCPVLTVHSGEHEFVWP
jgi:nucleotide-binding universal stress UspA family protein